MNLNNELAKEKFLEDSLITIEELQDLIGYSRRTVWTLLKNYAVPAYFIIDDVEPVLKDYAECKYYNPEKQILIGEINRRLKLLGYAVSKLNGTKYNHSAVPCTLATKKLVKIENQPKVHYAYDRATFEREFKKAHARLAKSVPDDYMSREEVWDYLNLALRYTDITRTHVIIQKLGCSFGVTVPTKTIRVQSPRLPGHKRQGVFLTDKVFYLKEAIEKLHIKMLDIKNLRPTLFKRTRTIQDEWAKFINERKKIHVPS